MRTAKRQQSRLRRRSHGVVARRRVGGAGRVAKLHGVRADDDELSATRDQATEGGDDQDQAVNHSRRGLTKAGTMQEAGKREQSGRQARCRRQTSTSSLLPAHAEREKPRASIQYPCSLSALPCHAMPSYLLSACCLSVLLGPPADIRALHPCAPAPLVSSCGKARAGSLDQWPVAAVPISFCR